MAVEPNRKDGAGEANAGGHNASCQQSNGLDPKDLLIADMQHFGESMWRNEEVGEKRFAFFTTLLTAVAAGLVALRAKDTNIAKDDFKYVAGAACAGLLVIGLLSYLRMLHRNRVTDQYQATLKYIRQLFEKSCPTLKDYTVPQILGSKTKGWLHAGYAETLAVLDGILLSATIIAFWPDLCRLALFGGLGLAISLWWIACAIRGTK